MAQADLEVRRRGGQLDREGEVVHLGQPGQLGVLVVGKAPDPLEEGGAELRVGQQRPNFQALMKESDVTGLPSEKVQPGLRVIV